MRTLILAVMVMLVGSVGTVHAGVLAPSKPSSVVTLVSFGACGTGSHKMDTRIMPDGTAVPFVIPPKEVLVLTGIEWVFTVAGGQGGLIDLLLAPPAPAVGYQVFSAEALAPGNGIGRGSALIPDVVAGPGVDICADVPFGASSVTLHGFLAKNK
jgi:hypothetical protein